MAELTYRLRINPHLITVTQAVDDWERRFGSGNIILDVEVDSSNRTDGQYFLAHMRFYSQREAMLFKLEFIAPDDSPIYVSVPWLL
jgi:hypothetical protein